MVMIILLDFLLPKFATYLIVVLAIAETARAARCTYIAQLEDAGLDHAHLESNVFNALGPCRVVNFIGLGVLEGQIPKPKP